MKLTDEIVRALHVCIETSFSSVAEFASSTNTSANTISKYLRKETTTIQKDTWEKIHPLIKAYLPKERSGSNKYELELDADQKILLDAFSVLPPDIKSQKLLEIVSLAKRQLAQTAGEK